MSSPSSNSPRQYKIPYQTINQTDAETTELHEVSSLSLSPQLHRHGSITDTRSDESNAFHNSPRDSQHNSAVDNSEPSKEYLGGTQWSVGLLTPAAIVGFLLLATAVAVAHYLYCHYLDQKFVESTIPQSWNAALSIAFARAFSTALAASASTAFTQLLWWYLRRRALPISKIDALFSINTSPLKLYKVGLLTTTPLLWFFGLLLPLISIATIFPPGSLVVQQLPDMRRSIAEVPTLNIDYRGNQTVAAFFENAIFEHDVEGQYQGPNVRYLSIGRRTLMGNAFLARPSPCGANCSYIVSFSGPGLRCQDDSPRDMDPRYRTQYNATSVNQSLIEITYRTRDGGGEEFNTGPQQFPRGSLRNISCRTQNADYSAHVSYRNLIQDVTLEVLQEQPIQDWWTGWPLNSLLLSKPSANGSIDVTHLSMSLDELYEFYHKIQTAAIRDMLWNQLSGYVKSFGDFQVYNTSKTIIQETPLAEWVYDIYANHYTDIYFDLSPRTVERLMHNITISMLNDASTTTLAEVTSTEYKAAYVFKDQARLIAAYSCTLGICLVFVLLGLFALLQNGTPAFSGGFLQILCTTTYGESIMNQMAKDASVRGTQNVPEDLANLKVRYGLVTDGSETKYAAFGTVDETEVLLKGSSERHR